MRVDFKSLNKLVVNKTRLKGSKGIYHLSPPTRFCKF